MSESDLRELFKGVTDTLTHVVGSMIQVQIPQHMIAGALVTVVAQMAATGAMDRAELQLLFQNALRDYDLNTVVPKGELN